MFETEPGAKSVNMFLLFFESSRNTSIEAIRSHIWGRRVPSAGSAVDKLWELSIDPLLHHTPRTQCIARTLKLHNPRKT